MNIEEFFVLEPDDIAFDELESSVLGELALARVVDDPRWAISALGELSKRGYRDDSARQLVIDIATRIVDADETWEHLTAYALSALYWHAQGAAIAAIIRIAKTCSAVVLEDIVDVLMPDLTPQFDEPEFRAAAAAVAGRLEESAETCVSRIEDRAYLELYRTLA